MSAKVGPPASADSAALPRAVCLALLSAALFLFCDGVPPQSYPNVVRTEIPVAAEPFYPVLTPDGRYILLTFHSGAVAKIRISDNSVAATVALSGHPLGIAVDPAGAYAYVARYEKDSVAVLRVSDLQVLENIPVGHRPGLLAMSPDGGRLYVANSWSSSVSVVSSDWRVIDSIKVGDDPWGIAVSPDGATAYVTCRGPREIGVIRTSGDSVVETMDFSWAVPAFPMLSPDGSELYVSYYDAEGGPTGGVRRLRLSPPGGVGTARCDASLTGMALVDDGRYLLAADFRDEYVYVIRTGDFAVVDRINVGHSPDYLVALPGQDTVYAPVPSRNCIVLLTH